MSIDLKIKLPLDRKKVDVNDLGEFIWWSNHLGTGLEDLLAAVRKVGDEAQNVRKHLHENESRHLK